MQGNGQRSTMDALTPTYTADLFPSLNAELIGLLRGLDRQDWSRPTLAKSWRVQDVVAHLLDGDLRKLSGGRDGHAVAPRAAASFAEIVELINELNEGGVSYARRLSPAVMIDLLEVTGA